MKKRRLFIVSTGQYRTFWHSWNNLVEKVVKPVCKTMDVYVCVGIDKVWMSANHQWEEASRTVFQTHLQNEWGMLSMPPSHFMLEWIDSATNPYFKMSVASLEKYSRMGSLDPYWFDYLTRRSGSCIEYAQFATIYNRISSQYEIHPDDLLMRTRTDILLRHPMCFDTFQPIGVSITRDIFHSLFPDSKHFLGLEETGGREASYYPPRFDQHKWVATLRKNLVYIMPLSAGSFIYKISKQYGDWDEPTTNHYWFNAESQFRGCLRHHGFTIWEYSQTKDECAGNHFQDLTDDFPIYAISR